MQEGRIDHRGHAGTGSPSPPEVLNIVTPDEELFADEADALNEFSIEEYAVERDDDIVDQPFDGCRADLAHLVDDLRAAGEPDGEAQSRGVLLGQHRRAPEVELPVVRHQSLEAIRRRDPVVVHQPDQIGVAGHRPLKTGVETAGASRVRHERAVLNDRRRWADQDRRATPAIQWSRPSMRC